MPTPPEPPKRGQIKFRDDVVPWLTKKKDQQLDAEVDDPLKWDREPAPKRIRNRWPAIIGLLAIAATVALVTTVVLQRPDDTVGETANKTPPKIFRADHREIAWNTLESFLEAETVEDKLGLVAWPDRVESRMRDYYDRHPDEAPELVGFQFLSSSPRFKTSNTYYLAISLEGENTRYWVLLEDGDRLKIDWECLVAYNPIDLEDFVASPPAASTAMRVTIEPADYYNFEFSDSAKYQAFALRDQPGSDQGIYGYAEIGSAHQRELARLVAAGNPVPVQLLLAPPSKAGQNACEIEQLLKPHWSGEE